MTHLVLRLLLAVVPPVVLLQTPTAYARSGSPNSANVIFYSKAHQRVPHPVLLFNIAQCHRLAKREERAVPFYEKFLSTNPTGPEAQVARDHLAEITKRQQEEAHPTSQRRRP